MKIALSNYFKDVHERFAANATLCVNSVVFFCAAVAVLGAVTVAPSPATAQPLQERGASNIAATPAVTAPAVRKKQAKNRGKSAGKSAAKSGAKARPASAKPAPKGFVETIMAGPRLTTTPPEAADWVRASRTTQNAQPRGARGPERAVLTGDQIRANEAQLDALRARHDRIAGRKATPGKPGSAAGKPEVAEVPKHQPGCALTCATSISVSRAQRR